MYKIPTHNCCLSWLRSKRVTVPLNPAFSGQRMNLKKTWRTFGKLLIWVGLNLAITYFGCKTGGTKSAGRKGYELGPPAWRRRCRKRPVRRRPEPAGAIRADCSRQHRKWKCSVQHCFFFFRFWGVLYVMYIYSYSTICWRQIMLLLGNFNCTNKPLW